MRPDPARDPAEAAIESRPREALAPLVLERLRQTLARCRGNPAYARRLGDARPEDIRSAADWQALPFLVKDEGTNFYPRQIESLVLARPGAGPEYQIVLERGPGGDRLAVLVETRPGFAPAEAERLRQDIRARLGLTAEVRLLETGAIPRPPGKAVRVVDRRDAAP